MTKHCSNSNPRKKNYLQPSPLWSREPTKQLTVTYNERVIIKCPYHQPMMANQQNMLHRSYNKIVFYHTIKTDRHEPQFWLLQNFDLSKISLPPHFRLATVPICRLRVHCLCKIWAKNLDPKLCRWSPTTTRWTLQFSGSFNSWHDWAVKIRTKTIFHCLLFAAFRSFTLYERAT